MYENNSHFQERRDKLEEKLETKEDELLKAKEAVIQNSFKENLLYKEHERQLSDMREKHSRELQNLQNNLE